MSLSVIRFRPKIFLDRTSSCWDILQPLCLIEPFILMKCVNIQSFTTYGVSLNIHHILYDVIFWLQQPIYTATVERCKWYSSVAQDIFPLLLIISFICGPLQFQKRQPLLENILQFWKHCFSQASLCVVKPILYLRITPHLTHSYPPRFHWMTLMTFGRVRGYPPSLLGNMIYSKFPGWSKLWHIWILFVIILLYEVSMGSCFRDNLNIKIPKLTFGVTLAMEKTVEIWKMDAYPHVIDICNGTITLKLAVVLDLRAIYT